MDELPKDLINEARKAFSASGELIKTSCKKKEMKVEFCLLNDILAKTVTTKAGSFDAVTHERFLLMTAIHGGIKINLSRFLFDILKDMVTPSSKQAKGFAAQICVLLKGAPDLTLEESKNFPPLKILDVKTASGSDQFHEKTGTSNARTDSPRRGDRNKSDHAKNRAMAAAIDGRRRWAVGGGMRHVGEGGRL
ncbi:hypothetical protein F511_20318 [Dorcoceras hygrometricum]|uniref:Uncharacterized protein n=1 Tax=Dorcoceras hygrometricum TaxID=472368 RepID=A0A2Z7CP77_9LAMI|nr:hypothetical protein F511_20318 [Dorcoceras hygrometricum]